MKEYSIEIVKCDKCKGSGFINYVICDECYGKGERKIVRYEHLHIKNDDMNDNNKESR